MKLGSFRIFFGDRLGSFRFFGGWGGCGTWNWVRFAFFGCWLLAFGSWACGIGFVLPKWVWRRSEIGFVLRIWVVGRGGIGFVSHFWVLGRAWGGKLGSFRIFWSSTGPPRWKLGSFRIIRPDGRGKSEIRISKSGTSPKFEMAGLKLDAAVA